MNRPSTMRDREEGEPLAVYLHLHSEALGADVGQRRRLAYAAMLAQRASAKDRGEAGRIATAVRDELNAVREATFLAQAQGKAKALEDWNDAGAKRVKGRDGLASLVTAGSLTEEEANTALLFRALVEQALLAGLGSQLGQLGETRAPSATSDARVRLCLRRAAMAVRITAAERAVGCELGVRLVREVVVHGRTIGSLTTSGGRRQQMVQALKAALAKVRLSLAASAGLRITGS